jgi:hypothetical protein
MVGRPGENLSHLRDRQPEIGRDVGLIDAGFPILNNVVGRHASTLQHRAATPHTGLYFDKGAI